jgi:hypothetical protein
VLSFQTNSDPDKKAKLIDQLLAGDDFARHQARFWRNAMLSKATNAQPFVKFPVRRPWKSGSSSSSKPGTNHGPRSPAALITSEGMLTPTKPREGGDAAYCWPMLKPMAPSNEPTTFRESFSGSTCPSLSVTIIPMKCGNANSFTKWPHFSANWASG